MIQRYNRFHGHGSLKRLYRTGKSVRTGLLALRYAPNDQRRSYRLAVVVSRKVNKSAVVRNRIRRRLYEQVRLRAGDFTKAYDLAIVVYDEKIADLPPAELAAELDRLFKKAKLAASASEHAIVEAQKKAYPTDMAETKE